MNDKKTIPSRVLDYLLLAVSSILFLWGLSCFNPFGLVPNYMVPANNQATDGGCVIRSILGINAAGGVGSGNPISTQQGSVEITLGSNTRWEESKCSISWSVLDKGLTTTAEITDGTLLTLTGSLEEAGTDLTTVHLESRPSNCMDSTMESERIRISMPVRFVSETQ